MTLKDFTNNRLSWFLLLTASWGAVAFAVSYQFFFDKTPCYLCVLTRIGFLIMGAFALITLINPKNHILRKIGYIGWIIGNSVTIYASSKLVYLQANPPLFSSCGVDAETMISQFGFMKTLPLLFEGSGDCLQSAGVYFGVSFEQLTLVLCSMFALTFIGIIGIRAKQRLAED